LLYATETGGEHWLVGPLSSCVPDKREALGQKPEKAASLIEIHTHLEHSYK